MLAFWKGNGTNIIRIFPYSAAQLSANDFYKRVLAGDGELTVPLRLTAGACAGMTATALTHPLDTVRLRLALPSHPYSGAMPMCGTQCKYTVLRLGIHFLRSRECALCGISARNAQLCSTVIL